MTPATPPGNSSRRLLVLLLSASVLMALMLSGPSALTQSAQLAGARDAKLRDEEIRAQMIVISRQLGVNCLTCHDNANFASDKKREFKVSREHMKLVQVLIDAGMNGRGGSAKADCYLCHRGQLKPDHHEPFDPLTMGKPRPAADGGAK